MTTPSPATATSTQARATVLVDQFTDGVLDPAKPMLGPVLLGPAKADAAEQIQIIEGLIVRQAMARLGANP